MLVLSFCQPHPSIFPQASHFPSLASVSLSLKQDQTIMQVLLGSESPWLDFQVWAVCHNSVCIFLAAILSQI